MGDVKTMIYLVNMPFSSIFRPSLGLGLIRSMLSSDGMKSKTLYLNLDFASKMGFVNYEMLNFVKRYETQVGEWLFAGEAWEEDPGAAEDQILDGLCGESLTLYQVEDPREFLLDLRHRVVPVFLDEAVKKFEALEPPTVVAFTSLYFQNMAIFSMARRLKKRWPNVKIVCGGPNFHGEMGAEFIEKLPFIDGVSIGEADDVIVPLFRALSEGRDPLGLQGVIYRNEEGSVRVSAPSHPVSAEWLDRQPAPDYGEFFEQAEAHGLLNDPGWNKSAYMLFETSRGCWKGERQHCVFCGLNHQGLAFRHKSPEKVLETIRAFAASYPVKRYHATDNIIPSSFFDDLLDRIAAEPLSPDTSLFWECRTTLTRRQVEKLKKARVMIIQPGVESLSTRMLNLMRKGVTAIKNVHLLKMCREYGIFVMWNIMINIPGEKRADYDEMTRLIPQLVHLNPPFCGLRRTELHKYSPYFTESIHDGKWAENLRPFRWYRTIYPEQTIDISRIAYFFEADWKDTLPRAEYRNLQRAVDAWIDVWEKSSEIPNLLYSFGPDQNLVLTDSRWVSRSGKWELDARETGIYLAINDPATPKGVFMALGDSGGTLEEVTETLAGFVKAGLAIRERDLFLGLALPRGVHDPPFIWRRNDLKIKVTEHYEII